MGAARIICPKALRLWPAACRPSYRSPARRHRSHSSRRAATRSLRRPGRRKQLKDLSTVQGGRIKIDASHGLKVDDATVVKADVPASNGVIHVIDRVLMPR
jgi:uncharacterized surface protein with fasciclin (FAS1) repeats